MTNFSKKGEKVLEQSFIENILRLNLGKVASFYMHYEDGEKVFRGLLTQASTDHYIIEETSSGKTLILPSVYLKYIVFDEKINYPGESSVFKRLARPFEKALRQPPISAESAIVLDGNTGSIVFEQNAFAELPIASLTKLMTAILAIEATNLNDPVTISAEAAGQSPSSCPLVAGDTLTMRDLLYCLLLRSGNDAAWVIAEYVAGSVPAFVSLMNQKAKALGLNQTVFTNPSGLDIPSSNLSTAYDLARLMRYGLTNPNFRKIIGTKTYQTTSKLGNEYNFVHKHRLLHNVYYVIGGKTGFTRRAGRTLVTAAEQDGQEFIVVTLNDSNDWEDTVNLLEYAFALYGITVDTPSDFAKPIPGATE